MLLLSWCRSISPNLEAVSRLQKPGLNLAVKSCGLASDMRYSGLGLGTDLQKLVSVTTLVLAINIVSLDL